MGQMEGDVAKGSLDIVVLGERSASVPLTPLSPEEASWWGCRCERAQ